MSRLHASRWWIAVYRLAQSATPILFFALPCARRSAGGCCFRIPLRAPSYRVSADAKCVSSMLSKLQDFLCRLRSEDSLPRSSFCCYSSPPACARANTWQQPKWSSGHRLGPRHCAGDVPTLERTAGRWRFADTKARSQPARYPGCKSGYSKP